MQINTKTKNETKNKKGLIIRSFDNFRFLFRNCIFKNEVQCYLGFRISKYWNVHIMLQLTKWLNIKNSSTILCISKCLEQIAMIKTKKKKNGAHKHLSHRKFRSASKYSRHVVLCKYTQKPQKQQKYQKEENTYF